VSDELLFVLRTLSTILLYAFIGVLLYLLWRDYRATAAQAQDQERLRGRLVVINVADGGLPEQAVFPVHPLTTIGRAPTNSVVLPDSFASNEHATLTLRGGRWWLQDRDSSNGTSLNGHPLKEPTVIVSGDIIGIGRVQLRLELD
jgi:hypothetical protein